MMGLLRGLGRLMGSSFLGGGLFLKGGVFWEPGNFYSLLGQWSGLDDLGDEVNPPPLCDAFFFLVTIPTML